jgi:hypothetical protein
MSLKQFSKNISKKFGSYKNPSYICQVIKNKHTMKTTVKDIQEQAQAIKDGGLKGSKAWERLQSYMKQFENVYEMWGELSVQRGQNYTPLSKIVKSDFFFN